MIGMHSRAYSCLSNSMSFCFCQLWYIWSRVFISFELSLILEVLFQKEQKLLNYLWILWISNANLFSTYMIFDFGVHYKLHKLIMQFKCTFNVKDINLFNYLLIDL